MYNEFGEYIGEDYAVMGLEPEVGRRRAGRRFGRALGAIVTGGGSELIRARRRAERAKELAERAMVAQGSPAIPKTSSFGLVPGQQRQATLPLNSIALAAAATGQLRVTCERPIQGQRLFLEAISAAGAVVRGILVTDIRVGVRPQECSVGEQPAFIFDAQSLQAGLQLDPLGVGVSFTVGLRNPTATDVTVSGALFGVAAD